MRLKILMARMTSLYGGKKIVAHLGNLGLDEALKGESNMSSSLSDKQKADILKKMKTPLFSVLEIRLSER